MGLRSFFLSFFLVPNLGNFFFSFSADLGGGQILMCLFFYHFQILQITWTQKSQLPTRRLRLTHSFMLKSQPREGGGGGGTRGVRHTGVCRSNRSLFWEKSLNIGYGFELENLKHTPHFCNFAVYTRYFRLFVAKVHKNIIFLTKNPY